MAYFLIRRRRGGEVAKELLGEGFAGILCADRWSAYNWVHYLRRQFCWADLKRHFKLFEDLGGDAKPVGLALQDATKRLFKQWHRVRDGTIRHATFCAKARPHPQADPPLRVRMIVRADAPRTAGHYSLSSVISPGVSGTRAAGAPRRARPRPRYLSTPPARGLAALPARGARGRPPA